MAGFFTVGLWTLLSRVFGFARDILIAGILGTGAVAEAFFVAFALPNMFRRFFAEGAFNMAFVPLFSKKLERGEDAAGFASDAFAGKSRVERHRMVNAAVKEAFGRGLHALAVDAEAPSA